MATFDINDVARRAQYTSTGQAGPYAFNFQVNAASELQVYKNDDLQTDSTHYNATIASDGTGSITFIDNSGSGGSDFTPSSGDLITIIGDQPLSRTTVFQVGQANNPTTLETEFDNVVIRQQQLKEMMDRSIQLKPSTPRTVTGSGTSGPIYWPYDATPSNNASRVIAYDSAGTSLQIGPTTANLEALGNIVSDISTVAGISSDITTVAGISANVTTVAGISSNVTTVSGISSNVTTVAGISSDITTLAAIDTEIAALSGVSASDLATVAGVSTEIATVSGISSNITTVAGISSDVTTVSGINADVTTVAGNNSNVTTVAGISANITTVAGISSDVTSVANNNSDITTVAGSISNVNTVASDITNVNTVATNIADVNNFSQTYRISATAPTTSLDIGDLWFDTTNSVMKVYSSSGWVTAASAVNGTAARFKYTATASQTTFSGADDNTNTLAYDAGFMDVYLNGIKLVAGASNDYVATNGTSIVLNSGAAANDILEAIAYGTFELANFSIDDANDVQTTGVQDGQVLLYNSSAGQFQPGNASSAEVYGFNKDSSGNLIVTTTNQGADNITNAQYAAFDDVLFSASGFTFSINSDGNLIATI